MVQQAAQAIEHFGAASILADLMYSSAWSPAGPFVLLQVKACKYKRGAGRFADMWHRLTGAPAAFLTWSCLADW